MLRESVCPRLTDVSAICYWTYYKNKVLGEATLSATTLLHNAMSHFTRMTLKDLRKGAGFDCPCATLHA